MFNKGDKYYTLFERTRRVMSKKVRIKRIRKSQAKTRRKLTKARNERIWVEQNPNIHILNYPFYKLVRVIKQREK